MRCKPAQASKRREPFPIGTTVRYIKLGEKGHWEKECLEKGIIRFGFQSCRPDRFLYCRDRRWDELKRSFLAEGRGKGTAERIQTKRKSSSRMTGRFYGSRSWRNGSTGEFFSPDLSRRTRTETAFGEASQTVGATRILPEKRSPKIGCPALYKARRVSRHFLQG